MEKEINYQGMAMTISARENGEVNIYARIRGKGINAVSENPLIYKWCDSSDERERELVLKEAYSILMSYYDAYTATL